MKRNRIYLVTFVLVTALCGCGAKQPTEVPAEVGNVENSGSSVTGAVTFTDDLNRQVTVENPQRVAALLGSFADVWVLAGGTVCASADDAWDDFELDMPADAINLGQTKELSLEKLFEAEPDFVIASTNTRRDMEWLEILEDSGIPTAYFDVADFEDYLRMLKICTDITGRTDLYDTNGLQVQKQIEEIVARSAERIAAGEEAPKVLSLRASAASIRAKNSEGNVLGEMLKRLGCINIADNDETLLENLSLERILEADPDYIFFVQLGDNTQAVEENIHSFIDEQPVWGTLTAVKEGRVYYMDKRLYNLKPNARWAESYEGLEKILTNEK